MRLYRGLSTGLISGVSALLIATAAHAQDAAIGVEAEAGADTEEDAEADADADATGEMEAETPAPEAGPPPQPDPEPAFESDAAPAPSEELDAAGADEAEAAAGAEAPEDAEAVEEPGGLSWMMFGDAYATVQTSQTGSPSPGHRAYASNSPVGTAENGFSLSFVGLDVGYEGDGWGVTSSLRFGPSVPIFYGGDTGILGIDAILQGYVTWAPVDILSIDLGMFGTIFGAEVAESWQNLNYTRGALYYLMQPFWHTGARASLAITDELSLTGMVVNDANQISLDPNTNLQGALQLGYSTGDFSLAVGTLQTLGENNASGFDRFFDLVATFAPGDLSLVANVDLNLSDPAYDLATDSGADWFGASLAAGYQFVPAFGASLRGEILDPNLDVEDDWFLTGTVTLDVKPVPNVENVVLRWDNRVEAGLGANANYWANADGDPTDVWFSSTIGLVAHTDGLF